MILTLDYIKKPMGWCPKMDTIKTPAHEYVGYENAGDVGLQDQNLLRILTVLREEIIPATRRT